MESMTPRHGHVGNSERMRQAGGKEKQGLVTELHTDQLVTDTERIFNGGTFLSRRFSHYWD